MLTNKTTAQIEKQLDSKLEEYYKLVNNNASQAERARCVNELRQLRKDLRAKGRYIC